jgi:hypothetical protein
MKKAQKVAKLHTDIEVLLGDPYKYQDLIEKIILRTPPSELADLCAASESFGRVCGTICDNKAFVEQYKKLYGKPKTPKPILKTPTPKAKLPITYRGIVVNNGSKNKPFMAIRILDLDSDIGFQMAKSYVESRKDLNPNWSLIRKPHSWTDYNIGPHITLSPEALKFVGEEVEVKHVSIHHFVDHPNSYWVTINVKLPEKFRCPYNDCHISIGQWRIK